MTKFARFIGVCIILVAIGIFGAKAWQSMTASEEDSTSSSATKTPTVRKANASVYKVNEQPLADIQSVITQHSDLDISVAITDLQTGKTYNYGDNSAFTAASVGKLITTATFMNKVEKGTASLRQTVGGFTAQTEIQKMLVESDNTAWKNMEEVVTLSAQQAYAESIGLTSYSATENTVSSADIALLLTKLSSGKLFNDSHTGLILSYMSQANYRGYIVAAIPDGVDVYHKVGLLEDRVHDAAIIKKGNRSYVLVVFTKAKSGSYDFSQAPSLFGTITTDSLQAFF
jgi:beta-lactamase class A